MEKIFKLILKIIQKGKFYRHVILALFALNICVIPAYGDDNFLDGFGDVPKMQQLNVHHNTAIFFDTFEGRIAEIFASSTASINEIVVFYQDALKQLGWQQQSAVIPDDAKIRTTVQFIRDGEHLALDFFPTSDNTYMRFTLSPLTNQQ